MNLAAVIAGLHLSEINCGLETSDRGVAVWLGDHNGGRQAERTMPVQPLADVAAWLHETALRFHPYSDYAKRVWSEWPPR